MSWDGMKNTGWLHSIDAVMCLLSSCFINKSVSTFFLLSDSNSWMMPLSILQVSLYYFCEAYFDFL